ncbi:MAG: HDOD domain-containing protein [Gammaproteobacteria bacterium]|nr:HDOD domain-containing protein [Gammaproteobacteria bacterium]
MNAIVEDVVSLDSVLALGPDLSTLPEVYLRVTQQLEDADTTVQEIGNTVQTDPAISTQLLKMVNSAYYGMPQKISTIAQAVALLGRDRLSHILMGSVMVNIFADPGVEALSLQEYWQHSVKTAIIARQLALQHDDVNHEPDALFTAGLLHDIGILLLASKLPLLYEQVEELKTRQNQVSAEHQILGFDHAELGAEMMIGWGLPELLVTCTRHHHDSSYDKAHATAVRIIYLANRLSKNLPPLDEGEALEQLARIDNWKLLGIPLEQICYACQFAEEQLFDSMESLGMINIELESD